MDIIILVIFLILAIIILAVGLILFILFVSSFLVSEKVWLSVIVVVIGFFFTTCHLNMYYSWGLLFLLKVLNKVKN